MPTGSISRVRFARIPTQEGIMFAAVSKKGVCRIALRPGPMMVLVRELEKRMGLESEEDPAALAPVAGEIEAYLAGRIRRFTLRADLTGMTPFQMDVLRATARVPFGRAASYGEIASRIGRPRAARAVGNALNANPVPLIVPCHRVVAGDGGLGGFGGGTPLKRRLLRLEGLTL
jgi:methylated-DNA-[protein]-cysteine S-methyltransferase